MVFAKYTYPLPNDGRKYSLSEKELVELLDAAYDKGFKHGVQSTVPAEITTTSSTCTYTLVIKDDGTIDYVPQENNHGQKN